MRIIQMKAKAMSEQRRREILAKDLSPSNRTQGGICFLNMHDRATWHLKVIADWEKVRK